MAFCGPAPSCGRPKSSHTTSSPRSGTTARQGRGAPQAAASVALIPIAGMPSDSARPRAAATEMRTPVKLPGPIPTPIASRSDQASPACAITSPIRGNSRSA